MRWVATHHPNVKWYIFQDDDLYVRVNALLAMLSQYDFRERIAFSGNKNLRGFAPGMWKHLAACDSNRVCAFKFPWMQPAIYSRAALLSFRPALAGAESVLRGGPRPRRASRKHTTPSAQALAANGLTDECSAFGVSHDVGLGIFNWMHSVPTVLLIKHIKGEYMTGSIEVHNVRRYKGERTIGALPGAEWKSTRFKTMPRRASRGSPSQAGPVGPLRHPLLAPGIAPEICEARRGGSPGRGARRRSSPRRTSRNPTQALNVGREAADVGAYNVSGYPAARTTPGNGWRAYRPEDCPHYNPNASCATDAQDQNGPVLLQLRMGAGQGATTTTPLRAAFGHSFTLGGKSRRLTADAAIWTRVA